MVEARKIANNMTDTRTKAIAYCGQVKEQFFDDIRYHVDKLENQQTMKNGPCQNIARCLCCDN